MDWESWWSGFSLCMLIGIAVTAGSVLVIDSQAKWEPVSRVGSCEVLERVVTPEYKMVCDD